GGDRLLLETHLLDFDREIYGERICVEFLHKIRDERKFESFEELKTQIAQDLLEAREIFTAHEKTAPVERTR
ncbi:MAG: riboflavin kinase, partial [Pseudomonadota bacterium]|nr:riboflavin kinase [Pseudomonadota bacterium]